MPFAYAGTRRRRNRDRRRAHDAATADAGPRSETTQPSTQPSTQSPQAERQGPGDRADSADRDPPASRTEQPETRREGRQGGVGEQDLHDPGSRDPDAPPVDNRS